MTAEMILDLLKVDLGIRATAYDERLMALITSAVNEISREGVTVDLDRDYDLVIMYAAWTWRRRDTMEGMPRMLRYTLNNRILADKMKE